MCIHGRRSYFTSNLELNTPPHFCTSFKREFESHWLMEHNWSVCLDSELRQPKKHSTVNHRMKGISSQLLLVYHNEANALT